jgi:hypothetical protein
MTARRLRVIVGIAGIVIGILGLTQIALQKRATAKRERMLRTLSEDFRKGEQGAAAVEWGGMSFRAGDRVRIRKWAGTFKPSETGAASDVQANAGRTGIVLRAEKRVSDQFTRIDPAEPLQIVRVRWLPQRWNVSGDHTIALEAFEATIHVSYLEVVPQ